jgi:serine/threonine protein kinase
VIKILDMGLARFFNKQQDSVTEKYDEKCVLGTADYLAPEQAVSSHVDVRADIYSLGGSLYFLLTGQTPFPDGTIAAKLVAHQTKHPKPVQAFRQDVPPGILEVLRRMLAKRPEDRYQEPIEVAEALAEWADQPIDPPPAKEMPGLCPLVLALTGHSLDSTGAAVPAVRARAAAARAGFARSGGNSDRYPPGLTGSGVGTAANPGSSPRYRPGAGVPLGGPVSTAKSSSSATAPLPPQPVEPPAAAPAGTGSGSAVALAPPRRTGLYVALGVAAGLLAASGVFVAYMTLVAGK